jgi:folate-binding protein YgfZ
VEVLRSLESSGGVPASEPLAEALRIEAGRPRFGQDADGSHLADEVGLAAAVSTTKGCYVGQEIVARLRTYGRVNRRLVGFRFPEGAVPAGSLLLRPGEVDRGRIEPGRVTSSADSPRFGPIGLGWAVRDVSEGDRLIAGDGPARGAIVASLPFA